jgi:hypothetical protein
MDFMHEQPSNGRSIRLFNVIDDFNREAPGIDVYFSLPSERVTNRTLRVAGAIPVRFDRRSTGVHHEVALEFQSRTTHHDTGRIRPEAAACHGRMASTNADC